MSRPALALVARLGAALLCTANAPSLAFAQSSTSINAPAPAPTTTSKLTTGIVFERVSFSGGILESDLAASAKTRVNSATNVAVPVQFSTNINGIWLIDIGSSFTTGSRTIASPNTPNASNASAATISEALSGLGDIRVRVSRRFDGLGLRLTVGGNIPTGVTKLDNVQSNALGVLASPALNLSPVAVGFGVGATLGVVKSFASALKEWGVAIGSSIEWRGQYDPFAALAAGASVSSYDPGEVVRVSAGATRLFGDSKALVTASLDIFGADKVSRGANLSPTRVQIGPTVALDAQYLPATTALRNVALFGGLRLRSALKRDDVSLPNSGNVIFEAGARGAKPISANTDLVFELSGRAVTGVAIDNKVATSASNSVAPVLGLAITTSEWTLQPAVTARFGSIDTGVGSGSFSVLGLRFLIERRF